MEPQQSHSINVFKEKHFLRFWVVRLFCTGAFQMQAVAVGWQIYDMTGSAFYLGLVGLVEFLPMVLLILFAGHAADHYNRKFIISFGQALKFLCMGYLAWGSMTQNLTTTSLLITITIIGIVSAFDRPSMQACLPGIVRREVFPRAAALCSTAFQIASILGPAIGGLLYAFGAASIYMVSGVLFLVAGILMMQIQMRQEKPEGKAVTLESLFAGIKFIKSREIILGAISMDLFAVLLGGATALLPIFAKDILHIGAFGLGILRSAPAIGAVLMSFFLGFFSLRKNVGKIMYASVAVFGLATVVFALSSNFYLSLAALIILGASDMISVVIRQTLVQLNTPDSMRGRVAAVNMLFIGTSNQLGEFESGITAAWFGTVPAAAIGGIGTLIVVGLWIRLFPGLYKSDKME